MARMFLLILTYIMFNFVFWLIQRGARTHSRIDPDCAITSEPVLGRELLPRESRYMVEFAVIVSTTGSICANIIMHNPDQHLITRFNSNCNNFP